MRKNITLTRICNIICAVMMLALIVCQFMPFWSTASNGDISIQEYTWLPHHNKELDTLFKTNFGKDYGINDVVLMPIVALVVGALGIVLTVLWSKKRLIVVCPLVVSILGVMNYLTNPAFQIGPGWQVHLALNIVMLAACIPLVIQCILSVIEWFNPVDNI